MTLQAAIAEELPFLRSEARARMVDTFEIRLITGETYDKDLKKNVRTYEVLFTTPGYVGKERLQPQRSEVGGRVATSVRKGVRIPWDCPDVPTGVVAVCTAVSPLTPARLLDREYRVDAPEDASSAIYCNLIITEELS